MASHYFIINPLAGYGEVNRVYERLLAEIEGLGLDAEFAKTISPGDGMHLAKVALKKGYRTVVCVGGDGTVHEALNGISGQQIRIGIVPFGLANLLANRLGIPTDWRKALRVIAKGATTHLDVGQVGDRYFLTAAGVGLEAEIASQRLLNAARGYSLRSSKSTIKLPKVPPLPLNIMVDEHYVVNVRAFSASIVNSAHLFQKSFREYTPDPYDRKLNLFVVSHLARGERLSSMVRGKRLTLDESVTVIKASRIQFLTPNDLPIHADGEIIRRTTPIEFTIAPFTQEIIVPK